MKENLKDILSHLNPDIDQEQLLKYLQDQLSAEQAHRLEKDLLDSAFEADAVEGLQDLGSSHHITALVEGLNRDLKKKTAQKKARRERRVLSLDPGMWYAILILLLLIVLSYFVIHRFLHAS